MARVTFTPLADNDTAEIIADLSAKAGHGVADRYNAAFEQLYEQLAQFPNSGAPRPRIGAKIRIGIISPYIVIYRHREADGVVRVLRIVHGRRRITGKLIRGVS